MKSPRNNDSLLDEIPNQELVAQLSETSETGALVVTVLMGVQKKFQMFRIWRYLNDEF